MTENLSKSIVVEKIISINNTYIFNDEISMEI